MTYITRHDLNTALRDVANEVIDTQVRPCPADPLRRAALVAEEAGEAVKAALDLTRPGVKLSDIAALRAQLRLELVHTASMATRALIAMAEEDNGHADLPTE